MEGSLRACHRQQWLNNIELRFGTLCQAHIAGSGHGDPPLKACIYILPRCARLLLEKARGSLEGRPTPPAQLEGPFMGFKCGAYHGAWPISAAKALHASISVSLLFLLPSWPAVPDPANPRRCKNSAGAATCSHAAYALFGRAASSRSGGVGGRGWVAAG